MPAYDQKAWVPSYEAFPVEPHLDRVNLLELLAPGSVNPFDSFLRSAFPIEKFVPSRQFVLSARKIPFSGIFRKPFRIQKTILSYNVM